MTTEELTDTIIEHPEYEWPHVPMKANDVTEGQSMSATLNGETLEWEDDFDGARAKLEKHIGGLTIMQRAEIVALMIKTGTIGRGIE